MLFENNEYDFDFDIFNLNDFKIKEEYNFNKSKNLNKNQLFSSKEGFLRGNMWVLEYEPFKKMEYFNLNPTCPKDALLYKIMELDFAINDLNLYLDLNPKDYDIYNKFKMYIEECIKLKDEYVKLYGPLSLNETTGEYYNWLNNPWPWDNEGGSMYV